MEGRSVVAVARYHRRLQLLLRAIFAVSGQVILASHWSILIILSLVRLSGTGCWPSRCLSRI